jgi:hypothetical protein
MVEADLGRAVAKQSAEHYKQVSVINRPSSRPINYVYTVKIQARDVFSK